MTFQFLVVEGDSQVFKVLLPGQSSTAFVEQIIDIPGGGLQGFRPGQGSPSSSSFHSPAGSDDDADEAWYRVFFALFTRLKKSAKVTPHSSPRVLRSVSSSELSAHQMPRAATRRALEAI